nr:hypothetical protein [Tanacetum cinerariifolium]
PIRIVERLGFKCSGPWKAGWGCSHLASVFLGLLDCPNLVDISPGFLSMVMDGLLDCPNLVDISPGFLSMVMDGNFLRYIDYAWRLWSSSKSVTHVQESKCILKVSWVIIYLVFILFMDCTSGMDNGWHLYSFLSSCLKFSPYCDVLDYTGFDCILSMRYVHGLALICAKGLKGFTDVS